MPVGVYKQVKKDYGFRICVICGLRFLKKDKEKPYKFKQRKCCSRHCNARLSASYCVGKKAHNNIQIKSKCIQCGKITMRPPSLAKRPFCGRVCMGRWMSRKMRGSNANHWQGGKIKRNCLICGKIFEFDKNEICRKDRKDTRNYCSMSCKAKDYSKGGKNSNWKGGKKEKICGICGKKYYVKPVLFNKSRFCSYSCLGINAVTKMPKSNTSIERIVEQYLIAQKSCFERQKVIGGLCVSDFFVAPNICIFCDGIYWHSIPKTKRRDKKINTELKRLGFVVIRLSEAHIKNGKFKQKIHNYI